MTWRKKNSWRRPSGFVLGSLLTLLLAASLAEACNVPVFRYALERWRADRYQLVLFHRGTLTAGDKALVDSLHDRSDSVDSNLVFETFDLDAEVKDEAGDALRGLFSTQQNPELPWLVVRYPAQSRIEPIVGGSKLTPESVDRWLDSPVRRELGKRLLAGETAVWLLLESGDAAQDKPAEELLTRELKRLEDRLELPELTDAPEDALAAGGPPLKLAFSLLKVSRDDADEQGLVQMLLGSEPDLAGRSDPMVFPVFGRGRALFPLIGAGITAENILDSASFLVGPCSCEIKDLNPGFDLLLATDFSTLPPPSDLFAESEAPGALVPIPPGPRPAAAVAATPVASAAAPASAPTTVTVASPTAAEQFGRTWRKVLLVGGSVLFVALLAVGIAAAGFSSSKRHSNAN